MAPIRRFSAAEKGKDPVVEPEQLPPKKRHRDSPRAPRRPADARTWCMRAPPGLPPRTAVPATVMRGAGDSNGGGAGDRPAGRVTPRLSPLPHAEDGVRELVVWAGAPPHTWILLPPCLREVLPARGRVTMQLRHDGCHLPHSYADVEVISSGQVYMTWGWGVVRRACAPAGRHVLHFRLDGLASLTFKVFGEDGRR